MKEYIIGTICIILIVCALLTLRLSEHIDLQDQKDLNQRKIDSLNVVVNDLKVETDSLSMIINESFRELTAKEKKEIVTEAMNSLRK